MDESDVPGVQGKECERREKQLSTKNTKEAKTIFKNINSNFLERLSMDFFVIFVSFVDKKGFECKFWRGKQTEG